jgi:hypothetical protein
MNITEVRKYNDLSGNEVTGMVKAVIDGTTMFVTVDPTDNYYAEIMRQVEVGELVIQEADTPE